jgi:glutaminyl-tRNA synthetase
MPTISGFRQRGYTPESIRNFCDEIGVAKMNSIVDVAVLENRLRHELNKTAPRVMAVLRPLRVVLVNYPEGRVEEFDCINNPEDTGMGARKVPFSKVLYIEQDDFMETPPKKFFRLSPGREVRLRYAYLITCVNVVKDPKTGQIAELHCTYDPATRGGDAPDGRNPKATLHWVSAAHSVLGQVRLYDTLFTKRDAGEIDEAADWKSNLNPKSLEILNDCRLEPSLKNAAPGSRFQFERLGYFFVDLKDSAAAKLVFNRTVTLRDTWAKITRAGKENE